MIKTLLHIAFLFLALATFAQGDDPKQSSQEESTWRKERKKLTYNKGKKYKGPEDWQGSSPTNIQDPTIEPRQLRGGSTSGSGAPIYGGGSGSSGSAPIYGGGSRSTSSKYSPQQVQRDRQKRYSGYKRSGGGGTVKRARVAKRPKPIKQKRKITSPPERSKPDSSKSGGKSSLWKIMLFIILIVAVSVVAYLIVKNYKPANKKVLVDVQNEWNPEVITKTELELKLEAAMEREDYRECVRIYFTFILKELIGKGWIRWKKEKTNHHYVMEMGKRENVQSFMECVRIYDLVWYGDYSIDQDIFELLKPTLENYYQSLNPKDE